MGACSGLGVVPLQVRCQGHYHYRQRSWPHFKGDGDVTVHVTNSKLALTAHVLKVCLPRPRPWPT